MQQIQAKVKSNTVSKAGALKQGGYKLSLRSLPKTLTAAAGLLKGKLKKTPLAYQKAFRKEW